MTTKFERQGAILRLVQERHLSTQAEVADALRGEGIDAVQATVSRDIAQLGLVKVRNGDGRLVYALPGAADLRRRDAARRRAAALGARADADRPAARDPDAARLRGRARRRDRRGARSPRSPARSPATNTIFVAARERRRRRRARRAARATSKALS